MKFTVNSQLKSMDMVVQNTMDDVSYHEYGVQVGNHVYSYFCPKGTYYITFSSQDSGLYSFHASLKDLYTHGIFKYLPHFPFYGRY